MQERVGRRMHVQRWGDKEEQPPFGRQFSAGEIAVVPELAAGMVPIDSAPVIPCRARTSDSESTDGLSQVRKSQSGWITN